MAHPGWKRFLIRCADCGACRFVEAREAWVCPNDPTHSPIKVKEE